MVDAKYSTKSAARRQRRFGCSGRNTPAIGAFGSAAAPEAHLSARMGPLDHGARPRPCVPQGRRTWSQRAARGRTRRGFEGVAPSSRWRVRQYRRFAAALPPGETSSRRNRTDWSLNASSDRHQRGTNPPIILSFLGAGTAPRRPRAQDVRNVFVLGRNSGTVRRSPFSGGCESRLARPRGPSRHDPGDNRPAIWRYGSEARFTNKSRPGASLHCPDCSAKLRRLRGCNQAGKHRYANGRWFGDTDPFAVRCHRGTLPDRAGW